MYIQKGFHEDILSILLQAYMDKKKGLTLKGHSGHCDSDSARSLEALEYYCNIYGELFREY